MDRYIGIILAFYMYHNQQKTLSNPECVCSNMSPNETIGRCNISIFKRLSNDIMYAL